MDDRTSREIEEACLDVGAGCNFMQDGRWLFYVDFLCLWYGVQSEAINFPKRLKCIFFLRPVIGLVGG
jgi:hypothetical protein